jgi:hypothetical protein
MFTLAMEGRMMKSYQFILVASGTSPDDADFDSRFFEAGCDDATLSFARGMVILDFDREARSFAKAVASAIKDVERAGALVVHVEPDSLVSLSEIAERASLTRAAISLYAKGERGSGFPAPIARITTDKPLWDWVPVSGWLFQRGHLDRQAALEAKVVRRTNIVLQARYKLQKLTA